MLAHAVAYDCQHRGGLYVALSGVSSAAEARFGLLGLD